MKIALLTLALLAAAAQRHEPPPLPPGQFCEHVSVRTPHPAHPCACQRECHAYDNGKQVWVQEDPQCQQYCTKDHCHCPLKGCD